MFITQISKSPSWSEEKAINPYPLSTGWDGVLVGELVGVGVAEMAVGVMVGEIVEVGVAEIAVDVMVGVVEVIVSTDPQPVNRIRKTTWIENLNLIMIVHPDSRSLQFILPNDTRLSLRSVNGKITMHKRKVL